MRTTWFKVLFAVVVALALVLVIQNVTIAKSPIPPGNQEGTGARKPLSTTTKLTYQGRLTNSSGTPVTSAVQMVFKIYDDAGTLLWTSATRSVTPVNGLFTVYLGDGSDPVISQDVYDTAASIGVTVGSDAEMTPRQPLNTVIGHSVSGPGVVGTSSSFAGVYGLSSSGPGVYGASSTSNALGAISAGGARDNATVRAINTNTTNGMAGYFTNNSAYATTHFANAGPTGEVLFLSNAYNGTTASDGTGGGPFIRAFNASENTALFQVTNVGDVKQVRDADGLVKAGVEATCANSGSAITRSFNNVGGTISISNLGAIGNCSIDFGFQVSDRFWVVSAESAVSTPRGANCASGGANILNCFRFDGTGNPINGSVMVLIY